MTQLPPALLDLMSRVVHGDASEEELLSQLDLLRSRPVPPASRIDSDHHQANRSHVIPGATVDLGRQVRCGFGEVIYGEGKSAELVTEIIRSQLDDGQSALVTRIDSGVAFQVRQSFEFAHHNPIARTLRVSADELPKPSCLTPLQASQEINVAVVTAGSTDAPIAEEAIETLHWMGVSLQRFEDIGVAGPHRLMAALPALRLASAAVVVAGMEGALPAVVAGHLSLPVFAVPTSVGYGANLGGLTPLMSMLTTCSASVAVVNINSGFKGGYMAGLVARQLEIAVANASGSTPKSDSAVTLKHRVEESAETSSQVTEP